MTDELSPEEQSRIFWHRLFGVALTHIFAGSPYKVELEKDLSLKQQFLDVVIIKKSEGTFQGRLPDGLENLAEHNLLTFKSLHEPFDDWTLKELTGHYVNYRKQLSVELGGGKDTGADNKLEPEKIFRLYGVSTRHPQKLSKQIKLAKIQDGVYEVERGTDRIRLIVIRDIPKEEHNAFWHIFSAVAEKVRFGAKHYQNKVSGASTVLSQLFGQYELEGWNMAFSVEQFEHDAKMKILEGITVKELKEAFQRMPKDKRGRYIKALSKEGRQELLKALPKEDRQEILMTLPKKDRQEILMALPKEDRQEFLQNLPNEDRQEFVKSLTLEELFQGFSPEEIRAYLNKREKKNKK